MIEFIVTGLTALVLFGVAVLFTAGVYIAVKRIIRKEENADD